MTTATAVARRRTFPRLVRGKAAAVPYLFVAPLTALFLLFMVAPLLIATYSSFFAERRSGLGLDGRAPTVVFVGLENYARALQDEAFLVGFGRVVVFGLVQVPVMLGVALVLALVLDSALVRFRRVLQLAIFLPYAVPTVVASLMWGFLYQPGVSPIVQGLRSIGVPAEFLSADVVLWSIANVTTWSFVGFNMIIMLSGLQAIPGELSEAARLDGASGVRIACSIKIPMLLPTLVLTLLFSVIGTVQLFNEPTVLRAITSSVGASYTPNMAIYETTTTGNDPNLGAAMAVLLGIVTFAASAVVSRFGRDRTAR